MIDFARRRTIMVDTQVRPSDVTKFPVIDAMLSVPRETFVPDALREAAYAGENLAISEARTLLDPRTFAKMLDVADVGPTDLVLDIGCGQGYSAAVIARMAEAVVALEDSAEMCAEAENALGAAGADNVAVVEGPLTAGAAQHGPYDLIMLEGAVEHLPDAILGQLKDGGRIVAIFADARLGTVRIGYNVDGAVNWRFAFNGSAPLLPGFERAPGFVL